MKYTKKVLEDKRVQINLSLDAKEWEDAVQAAYEKNKGKYSVQGFRKGHTPRKVLEKTYGTSLFYDDAIEVIKELMMFDEVMPYDIEIEPEEMDWYNKEYYVTLDDNFKLWVQPAYLVKEDGSVYYQSVTDVLFIADDCNSAILNRIDSEEVLEVTYDLDEDDFEVESECHDCCGECCCHNDSNENTTDNSVKTRVAVDNSGRIYGFEKTGYKKISPHLNKKGRVDVKTKDMVKLFSDELAFQLLSSVFGCTYKSHGFSKKDSELIGEEVVVIRYKVKKIK